MCRILIPFLLYLFITITCFGQDKDYDDFDVKIVPIPKTPEVAVLGRYGNVPVSIYTGIPNIAIPLVDANAKSVSLPISLSYHAGGIKVEEIATYVGLGWNLSQGGVITRTTRGIPDDVGVIGYLYTEVKPSQFLSLNDEERYQISSSAFDYQYDLQPDVYSFSFGGFSGEFYFDETGEINYKSLQNIKIEPLFTGDEITSWNLITPDGARYYFGKNKDVTRSATEESTVMVRGGSRTNPIERHITSWFLLEAEDVNATEKIELFYTDRFVTICTQGVEKRIRYTNGDCPAADYTPPASFIENISKSVRISEIRTPTQVIKFDFTFSRLDLANDHALSKVSIFDENGTYIKGYNFGFDYFFSGESITFEVPCASTEERTNRLKLVTLTEEGSTGELKPSYYFNYDESQRLPERFSKSKDYWGYYNGKFNTTLIPSFTHFWDTADAYIYHEGADREVDPASAQVFVLKEIKYPTQGSTTFEYESNDADKASFVKIPNKAIRKYDGIVGDGSDYYEYTFTLDHAAHVDYEITNPPCPENTKDCYIMVTTSGITDPDFYWSMGSWSETLFMPKGTYLIKVHKRGTVGTFDRLVLSWMGIEGSDENEVFAGGLRVKTLTDFDPVTNQSMLKRYRYDRFDTPYKTSGLLVYSPVFYTFLDEGDCNFFCYGIVYSAASEYPQSTTQGSFVGYTNVRESVDGQGYTDYIYSFQYNQGGLDFPYTPPNTAEAERGNLLFKKVYSNDSLLLASFENKYTYTVESITSASLGFEIAGYRSGTNNQATICWNSYETSGAWRKQTQSIETQHVTNEHEFSISKSYDYQDAGNLQPTDIYSINSKGDSIKQKLIYASTSLDKLIADQSSFNSSTIQKMKDQNMIHQPIQKYNVVGSKILDAHSYIYSLEGEQIHFSKYIINTDGISNDRLFVVKSDERANPLEVKRADGIYTSYQYNSKGTFLISATDNAHHTEVSYTSFEDDSKGGWEYIGIPINLTEEGAPTGKKVYQLSSGSINKSNSGASNNNRYKLSFWARTERGNQSWTILDQTLNLTNTWTYFEREVTSSSISLNGSNIYIDELRLHPVNAVMTTYTYKPGVGTNSVTDPTGQSIRYEYDNFGRLLRVWDNNNNILQQYEYKYASE